VLKFAVVSGLVLVLGLKGCGLVFEDKALALALYFLALSLELLALITSLVESEY